MLPVVSQICRFAPQLHESAGGLPKTNLFCSHSCPWAWEQSAMEVSITIAFVLSSREPICNESFKTGEATALSLSWGNEGGVVAKISTSVFITNFPESFSAKELFHSCKQYGHVVDSFIPTKRSKSGKRYELQVIACARNVNGITGGGNSYMNVVKGQMQPRSRDSQAIPAVVLDDECLLSRDLSKSLLGRVKEFASLANLKMALSNKGFVDIKTYKYMGESNIMRLLGEEIEGRNILEEFKIIYRGKVFWIHANETPGWVPDFVDESDDKDQNDDDSKDGGSNVHEMGSCGGDSDVEEVPVTLFEKDG
ncbi:nucleotide-binding alpha-beta plait domain-containing protein [Tanacetum coccineum]